MASKKARSKIVYFFSQIEMKRPDLALKRSDLDLKRPTWHHWLILYTTE
jgi:hypothetical protein